MDKKERDTQRALGNMEEYRVSVEIPIKLTVKMQQIVEAVSKEDAIEQLKTIHDIIPDGQLLHDIIEAVNNNPYKIKKREFDDSIERKYESRAIHKSKGSSSITESSPGLACDGGS